MTEVKTDMDIAVILAAGMGTRMKSESPKTLHPILGEPMIEYVINALELAGVKRIITVLGYGAKRVEAALGDRIIPVYQQEQLGTGHALLMALPVLNEYRQAGGGDCLVVYGDTPLLKGETLSALRKARQDALAAASVMTADLDNPTGYGRVIRDGDRICRIVEEKSADPAQKLIREINVGAYSFDIGWLSQALENLSPANTQGEYYLTDTIEWLADHGQAVTGYRLSNPEEGMGVNDRAQLAEAQEILRRRINRRHMLDGVTVDESAGTMIGPFVQIGMDTVIGTGTQIFGRTVIGEGCVIGPRSKVTDCKIGDGTTVDQSTLIDCVIGKNGIIGPYSYLRPDCVFEDKVKAGAFVEMKNAKVATGSKIPHLSYIGDCEIGKNVNIGAGSITCNYDGVNKFKTIIEDDAFTGSNSNFVAPVTIGRGAYTAAGSTITMDVPPDALGVARGRQSNIIGWTKRNKIYRKG